MKASKDYNLGLLHVTASTQLSLWEDSLFVLHRRNTGPRVWLPIQSTALSCQNHTLLAFSHPLCQFGSSIPRGSIIQRNRLTLAKFTRDPVHYTRGASIFLTNLQSTGDIFNVLLLYTQSFIQSLVCSVSDIVNTKMTIMIPLGANSLLAERFGQTDACEAKDECKISSLGTSVPLKTG